ncbi:MAG: YjjW family glycine radical enzyme activase, partial [Eubacteriales bacterium]
MSVAPVNRIIPHSVVDGPGNRTAVFLQECNLDCGYCHNPETIVRCGFCGDCVQSCPVNALKKQDGKVIWDKTACVECDACIQTCQRSSSPKTETLTPDQLMSQIAKNIPFIKGVTISGGECTLHRDFLVEFGAKVRGKGRSFLLDSNGTHDFSKDPELLNVVDGVMLDVKCFDPQGHIDLTG